MHIEKVIVLQRNLQNKLFFLSLKIYKMFGEFYNLKKLNAKRMKAKEDSSLQNL